MSGQNRISKLKEYKDKADLSYSKLADKIHNASKHTARERMTGLFDEGTFIENNVYFSNKSGLDYDSVVTGYGSIDGRLTFAFSQDPSEDLGAVGIIHAQKIVKLVEAAVKAGSPVVGILDSNGAHVDEGVNVLAAYGEIFKALNTASGIVPIITLVLGTCAGAAAIIPSASDFTIISEKSGEIFLNSPAVLKAVTGKDIGTAGSAKAVASTGLVHFIAPVEGSCISLARQLLSYLPQNNVSGTVADIVSDDINRKTTELNACLANDSADVKNIIMSIADIRTFFEIQSEYASNMVTAFVKLGGVAVGIVANQPTVKGGAIDADSATKAARFVRFCDAFNIPLITIVNTPGFEFSLEAETEKSVISLAKLTHAYSEATTAIVTLITGKAYAGGYVSMGSKSLGADVAYAWPSAEISVLDPETVSNFLFTDKLANSENPVEDRRQMVDEYRCNEASPYTAAKAGLVDDVISPEDTRQILISSINMLSDKRVALSSKKHSNISL